MPSAVSIRIPRPGGRPMAAAFIAPEGEGPHPGVIVIHEAAGLNGDMRRKAERFARMGYAAIAPDLISHRSRLKPLCLMKVARDMRSGEGEAFADLLASQEYLASQPGVDRGRIGVIGFCLGGGFAIAYAAKGGLRVAAPFYGTVPRERATLAEICPVVGGYGGKDRAFGRLGGRLQRHLVALGVENDIVTYPEAGHSFMSEGAGTKLRHRVSPSSRYLHVQFDAAASADSWQRIEAFFARHLGERARNN